MDITVAQVAFMGEFVGAMIAMAEPDAGSVGIELDPCNQMLKRPPAVRLKWMRE